MQDISVIYWGGVHIRGVVATSHYSHDYPGRDGLQANSMGIPRPDLRVWGERRELNLELPFCPFRGLSGDSRSRGGE